MTNAFSEYTDHVNSYDPEMFLGRLSWYSIPETTEIEHVDFCKVILTSGVAGEDDDVVLPKAPRTVDVFKRACKAAERSRVQYGDGYLNFLVRDAGNDSDVVYRELVVECLDGAEHVLSYTPVGKFKYFRSTEKLNLQVNVIGNESDPDSASFINAQTQEIVTEIERYYEEKKYTLIAYPIREFIRRTIEKNYQAILARQSGGVYFVTAEFEANITALEDVVNSLDGCTMFTFPVVNDGKMREMVRIAFEEESCSEADKMMAEMAAIMKDGKKISVDRFGSFKEEYEFLRKKVVDYSDTLDTAMELTASRLEMMQQMLFDIIENVKV